MSKADKMFEELGYFEEEQPYYLKHLIVFKHVPSNRGIAIIFDEVSEGYHVEIKDGYMPINTKEHLAIHEKMKELGWIEGGIK